MWMPSAPAATAARAIAGIRSGRPVAWLGSTMIGRWLCPWMLGTTDRSSVFRVESSNVRMPRSQRITCRLPSERTYSADISRSLTVALMPALEQDRHPGPAALLEQVEVLHVAGADLEDVGVALDQLDLARVHDLGDDRHAEPLAGGPEDLEPVLARVPGSCTGWSAA